MFNCNIYTFIKQVLWKFINIYKTSPKKTSKQGSHIIVYCYPVFWIVLYGFFLLHSFTPVASFLYASILCLLAGQFTRRNVWLREYALSNSVRTHWDCFKTMLLVLCTLFSPISFAGELKRCQDFRFFRQVSGKSTYRLIDLISWQT